MGDETLAGPTSKMPIQWIQNVVNLNDNLQELHTISNQPGSGSAANHQSFTPIDKTMPLNGFYRVSQTPNQSLPSDMFAKSLAEHNKHLSHNMGEELLSDQHFMVSTTFKNRKSSINNVASDDDRLTQEQYLKFKNLVIKGCETAEQLAYFHRNRPCFKKINCLCARLKQDVGRADSVLANINSQGVPWAVKDFIFVFTRIVSAWNIIKDYVYNTSDGMSTIKSAISDRLVTSFLKWQEITTDLIEDLTISFDGLQELTLLQTRNGECQKATDSSPSPNMNDPKISTSDVESFVSFKAAVNKEFINELPGSDRSSDSSIGYMNYFVKPLSMADCNFDYITTGIYECTIKTNQTTEAYGMQRVLSKENDLKNHNAVWDDRKPYVGNVLSEMQNAAPNTSTNENHHLQIPTDNFSKQITETSQDSQDISIKKKSTLSPKTDLLQKVCSIEESNFFFSSQFTKNYFPDFLNIVPDFEDLRSINKKAEMDVYNNIYEVVFRIRQIFVSAKLYLQERCHELLERCVLIFEREFEHMLMREFAEYNFNNMTGYQF